MIIRVTPDLESTEKLLIQILPHVIDGNKVAFNVAAGESRDLLARIRTMLSRVRARQEARGTPFHRFRLRSSVCPETVEGIRMECVMIWKDYTESHMIIETLEDILTKKQVND